MDSFSNYRQQGFGQQTPGMVRWVMTHSGGLITTEKQAEYTLITLSILAIVLAIILYPNKNENPAVLEAPPGYEIVYPDNAPPRLEKIQ